MTNRQWKPPVDEVYAATESPNGELGFYVVGDGTGTAYRARTRPPSFIHFAAVPVPDRGAPDQRRGGGAGQPEHHRGGAGSMSGASMAVLSDDLREPDQGVPAALPEQAGGDAAGAAPRPRRAALRAAGGDPRDRRPARPEPGRGPRHDELLRLLPRRGAPARQDAAVGLPQPGVHAPRRRGAAGRTVCEKLSVKPRRHDARTARSRSSSPSASAPAKGRRRC